MKKLLKYGITVGIGLLIAFGVCMSKNLFAQTEALRIYRILCDAFFLSGVCIMGAGLLAFVSREGMFDGITYYAGRMLLLFQRNYEEKRKKALSYYEYKQSKNRDSARVGFLLIVGGCFIAIAFVFLFLFNRHFTV